MLLGLLEEIKTNSIGVHFGHEMEDTLYVELAQGIIL